MASSVKDIYALQLEDGRGRTGRAGRTFSRDRLPGKALELSRSSSISRAPFLEDATVVHHRDAFDDAQSDIHVVLDDDVADVVRQ